MPIFRFIVCIPNWKMKIQNEIEREFEEKKQTQKQNDGVSLIRLVQFHG